MDEKLNNWMEVLANSIPDSEELSPEELLVLQEGQRRAMEGVQELMEYYGIENRLNVLEPVCLTSPQSQDFKHFGQSQDFKTSSVVSDLKNSSDLGHGGGNQNQDYLPQQRRKRLEVKVSIKEETKMVIGE